MKDIFEKWDLEYEEECHEEAVVVFDGSEFGEDVEVVFISILNDLNFYSFESLDD